eukprot:TRINITY_DN1520_c2_g1_i1.p1 TRINITY_DN1520_c2_g1~~TRINITY_DN1520_c2_g1_i1.p1  ORF type:complete len:475 (+),score=101.44 TRINITY_DN1520_c2_g1_i1:21-1445(+)
MQGSTVYLCLVLCLVVGIIAVPHHTTLGRQVNPKAPANQKASWGTTHYFDQLVDHFDPLNKNTYKQMYIVDNSSWTGQGPIFIFLGGEAPLPFFDFQEYLPRLLAPKFKALYVAIEHRYYGVSNPTPDYSTPNLRYLSSRQALADAANFITTFNRTSGYSSNQWIVWGCSYSGALSAWFRAKYPNLVIGSIAPSGPVYAMNNFTAYYNQFTFSANYYNPKCVTAASSAVHQIQSMLSTASGRSKLEHLFQACSPLPADEEGQYYFIYTLTGAVGAADQFENPPGWPLNQTCNMLLASDDYVSNWAKIVITQSNSSGPASPQCIDYNEGSGYINPMKQSNNTNRSWMFQVCTEFGWFQTAYPGTSIFWTQGVEHQLKWCEEIFGIKGMKPDLEATNEYYGGYELMGSNILFTNGVLDPWHRVSINQDTKEGVQAVTYVDGHCATMDQPTNQDSPSLIAARNRVSNFIAEILRHHH